MKKLLIAAAIIGSCGITNAESAQCNYSTDFNIKVNQSSVLLKKTNGDSFEFKKDQLFINGKPVELNDKQKEVIVKLNTQIRSMVPKIAVIAIHGAELGVTAATMVLNVLFDDDPSVQQEIIAPIKALTSKIKENISNDTINTEALEKLLDESFDEKFEQAVESAAAKYAGKIIGDIFSSIFSGNDEKLKALDARMKDLEKNIEKYVETNAAEIKAKAEALCQDMLIIDALDNQLEGVKGYPEGGLIKQDSSHGFKFNHISWQDD